MKITYRQASRGDVTCQFRYYLVEQNLPEIALRFKIHFHFMVEDDAVRVIRILHGKRDVRSILEQEKMAEE